MRVSEIPTFRQFVVKYIGATNTRGSRVSISEPKRFTNATSKTIYLSYDYEVGDILQQAINWLSEDGRFKDKIKGRAYDKDKYIVLVDSWGEDFVELK